jgi:hypothetical protein
MQSRLSDPVLGWDPGGPVSSFRPKQRTFSKMVMKKCVCCFKVFTEYEWSIFAAQGDAIQGCKWVPLDGRCEWSQFVEDVRKASNDELSFTEAANDVSNKSIFAKMGS